MSRSKAPNDEYEEGEASRRRDAVLKHMLSRPPQPHKPIGEEKKARPASKGQARKGKSRI